MAYSSAALVDWPLPTTAVLLGLVLNLAPPAFGGALGRVFTDTGH